MDHLSYIFHENKTKWIRYNTISLITNCFFVPAIMRHVSSPTVSMGKVFWATLLACCLQISVAVMTDDSAGAKAGDENLQVRCLKGRFQSVYARLNTDKPRICAAKYEVSHLRSIIGVFRNILQVALPLWGAKLPL